MKIKTRIVKYVISSFLLIVILNSSCANTKNGVESYLFDTSTNTGEVNEHNKEMTRPEGYDEWDIYDKYVVDVLDSEEFHEINDLYREKFGNIHRKFFPADETLRDFKEKVEESLETGYTVIPEAYQLETATSWIGTKRFEEVNEKYKYGGIPTMQIAGISMDDLEALVDECNKQNKDLFPEYFNWISDPDIHY